MFLIKKGAYTTHLCHQPKLNTDNKLIIRSSRFISELNKYWFYYIVRDRTTLLRLIDASADNHIVFVSDP